MAARRDSEARKHHEAYQTTALVLQGGGALGAYQCGVVEGLAEAGIHPNWVAGISIGAINAALIAGNPPERRVERLREFWQTISRQPFLPTNTDVPADAAQAWPMPWVQAVSDMAAWRALTEGQNGFFVPRLPWLAGTPTPATASYYDTTPLYHTLERLVDFSRVNDPRHMRVSVGAVNVRTGNFEYFDNTRQELRVEHFVASGSLPPGFAAVDVDGEYYWDGGLVSNTPLYYVLMEEPRKDSLVFQVDLWSAAGDLPTDLMAVAERQKDIQYSSRTRMVTTAMERMQVNRRLLREVMELVPPAKRNNPWYRRAAESACDRRFNVIHLIYKDKPYDGHAKDYQFGVVSLQDHWCTGRDDMRRTLAHPEWLAMPSGERSFVTHDVHRDLREGEVSG